MPRPRLIPTPELIKTCEALYARDGYVKWAEVATIFGVARQSVRLRVKDAVAKGEIPSEDAQRWHSMASRAALTRRNRMESRLKEKFRLDIQLTTENYAWLNEQCTSRGVTKADIVNGLINKESQIYK